MKRKHFIIALMAMLSCFAFTAKAQTDVTTNDVDAAALFGDDEYFVNCDYNSSTSGWGTTKFSNYDGAFAKAKSAFGAKYRSATIIIEKTNTLSGNSLADEHDGYTNLAVIIKDGATIGVAISKWDMTYPVTVEPGGAIVSARGKSSGYINSHIKNTLTIGSNDSDKKAVLDFLGGSYQSGSVSIMYNGKIVANNATIEVGDLGFSGTGTFNNCDITVGGVLATGKNNNYKQTMTNTTVTVGGTNYQNENTYYSTEGTLLHNLTLDNSTIAVGNGDGVVVKTVTLKNGSAWTVAEGASVNTTNAKVTVYGSVEVPEELENNSAANELVSNTAVSGYTPTLPAGVTNLTVELTEVEATTEATTKVTFNVEPKNASGAKVSNPSAAITFRLPVPAAWSGKANVYHEGTLLGAYPIKGENGAKYVEVSSSSFSEFSIKAVLFDGEGTEASPYIIDSSDKLVALRNSVNGGEAYAGMYFKLTSDITLSGEWTAIGKGSRSSKSYTGNAFKGVFDGGNNTISGLTITSTTAADAAIGLFGVVDGGTVKNLNLEVNINVANSNLAGGAIGMMLNGATAENITVNGAIVGNDGVGGIAGRLVIDGTIANCTNNASVTSSYGGIGGIVGKAYYEDGANTATFASITNCTNKGTIKASMYVGGIAGLARANVSGCVNEGAIVGGTQTGGIVGQLMAAGTVSDNENKAKVTGTSHVGGIIGDYTQSGSYTYNNVSIATNTNRGEISATGDCAAILGCNNVDGFTAMTATGNVSYYFVEGLALFGNPEDMTIDATNKFILPTVAIVNGQEFSSFTEALAATKTMSGDVTVEIYDKVTFNQPLIGNYTSIKFVGKEADAEMYLDVQGYTTATGKKVSFTDLKLSKSEGGFITNAGFMNVAFGIYDVEEVTYTNCTFENGACASSGKVTFNGCTFKKSWDKYALWAYGNVDVTVQGSTFANYRGIKMYAENGAVAGVEKANLTVKNSNFSAVDNKPAIVLTYGESVVLEGNTYSSTGTFELDLDGKPNGVAVTSDVAPVCVNDNGACGVLVDGKIYTTVAQAAEVATETSTVTLLHSSNETVEFPMGTTIEKNGFTADNVTTAQPFAEYVVLPISMTVNNYKALFGTNTVTDGTNYYATLQAAVEAVAKNAGVTRQADAVLYCKPGADVGSLQHAPVVSTLTIYGNGANVTGGSERDFDLGNTDPSAGKDITADMTLTVKHLNGCGAWGAKATDHTVNLVFENCANMGKVFISGTTGTLNITMNDCAFEGVLKEAVYSNADGAITLNNVAFSNLNKAINLNHKADGTQTVTINGCSFTNCGADVAADQIPVRVLSSVDGGKSVLNVSNTTFAGTPEGGADILLDYGVGETTASVTATAANVFVEKENNVATKTTVTESEGGEFTNVVPVAKLNGIEYMTLAQAVAAVEDGGTITLIANETFTKNNRYNNGGWWDGLGYSGDKSFTIDLAGFTISQNGALNDYLMWFKNDGAKANTITLKNGTLDAGTTAYCALATASSNAQKITVNLENIKVINNKSDGSTLKIRGGAELNVKAGTEITGKNSYLGIECVASTVNIYDGAEIYMNGTSSYNGCLVGVCAAGTVNVYGGYGKGVKGGFIAMTSGGTINIEGGEWIANTDGTVGNNSNLYVLTAQSNKNESGFAGPSIINVTGGTFRGGMDAWVLNNHADEKAELNISGGNFNANPASYVAENSIATENNGVWTVAKAAAKVGNKLYASLEAAFKAATSGCTIDILSDVTVDYNWDARNTGGKFTVPVTINGNGNTIKFTASVNDNNYQAPFRFEADATVKNLTIDMSEVTDNRFRAISSKGNLTVDGCKFIGKDESLNCRAIIFGEGAGANVGNLAISITNSEFINWKRGITDNENAQDVKTVTITGNKLTDAGVGVSAKETVTFTGNKVAGAYVNIKSYTAGNSLNVVATDNTLEENTETAYNVINAGGTINAQEGFNASLVAKIGEATYGSLQVAVNAVKNGETITLTSDVTENVTLTEKVGLYYTIDGAGKTMDGSISVTPLSDTEDNRRITIKNINFVNTADAARDFISSVATNHYPRLTVEGCTFTGNGKATDVAVRLKSSHSVVIKNCTATGMHSFIQNTSGWNLTIEYVQVTDSKSAFALGTVQGVTVKGCTADVEGYGIRLDAQYNNNAVIESNEIKAFIPVVVRKAKVESNITVQGTNKMTATNTDGLWMAVGTSEYEENGKMPDAATAQVKVALTDTGLEAAGIYGSYYDALTIHVGATQTGRMVTRDIYVATMDEAVAEAKAINSGAVIYKVYGEVELTTGGSHGILDLGNNVVIEGADATAKLTIVGGGVPDIKGVTFKNITLADEGTYLPTANEFMYQNYIDCTFENVTFVDGIRLSGTSSIKDSKVDANTTNEYAIWLDEGEFTMTGTTVVGGADAYGLVKSDKVSKITITGNTFQYLGEANKEALNVKEAVIVAENNQFIDCVKGILPADKTNYTDDSKTTAATDAIIAGNNTVTVYYAAIGDQKFETLLEAINAVQEGETIELVRDVTMSYGAREAFKTNASKVVINGNGKTLTLNQTNSDWSSFGLANNSKLVLNNMTIEKTGYGDTNGAWNTHAIIFSCPVEMNGVTVNNSVAVQAGAALANVTINEANGYYGLWINGNGQTVTVNGGAINATNGGRGIKIADEYIDAPAQVTLSVDGTVFSTAKKSAVLVSSTAGAKIAATNVNIANVAEDSENFVWVDEDWAQHFGNVEVTGATVRAESAATFTAAITANGAVQAYYKTLAEAINAAQAGATVELLADVTLAGGYADAAEGLRIEKEITLNGNGHTIDCGNFLKGIRVYNPSNVGDFNVNFDNVKVVNNVANGRCIDTRSGNINLKVNSSTLIATNGNSQPLTIGGNDPVHRVSLNKTTINAGASGYAVISFVSTNVDINGANNSTISGFAAFYLKGDAKTTNLNLGQGIYTGTNNHAVESGVFGTIVLEGDNNVVNLMGTNATVKAVAENTAPQAAFLVRGANNTIKITKESAKIITEGNAYEAMVNADNAATTKFVDMGIERKLVAENRGYQFYSFEEAVRFAGNEGTIKIVNDFELAEAWTVAAGQNITLDLNGKTVSYTSAVAGEDMITNRGNLTITDSSDAKTGKLTYVNIDATASNVTVSTISSEPGSVLNITAGTVENKTVKADGSSIYSFAIDMLTNGNLGNVTATIAGGTVYSDYMAIRQFNNGTACKNTLNINGGYIYGAKRAVQVHLNNNAAYTTISGGKVEAGADGYAICNFAATGNLEVTGGEFIGAVYSARENFISGGTYNNPVEAAYCAEGYMPNKNANGTYGVVAVVDAVAIIDGFAYSTFAEAIKACVAGDNTITLLADCAEKVTITQVNGTNITINGNGKTYTGTITVKGDKVANNLYNTETLTFQNINFAPAYNTYAITAEKNTYVRNITVDGCTFKGNNDVYGIRVRNGYNYTVKNTTVEGVYTFFNASEALNGLTVDNVTVKCANVAFSGAYGFVNASFKNVTVESDNNGVKVNNPNGSALTFEDCSITAKAPVTFIESAGVASALTAEFNGTNTMVANNGGTYWFNIVEADATDATFKAIVNDADLDMSNTAFAASVGNVYYSSLQKAINEVADGATVVIARDIELDAASCVTNSDGYSVFVNVADKAVTIDLNGKAVTANLSASQFASAKSKLLMAVFSVDTNGNLTLNDTKGTGKVAVTANDASVYSLISNYDKTAKLTINDGSYELDKARATSSLIHSDPSEAVVVNGGNFYLGNVNTGSNGSPWIFNVNGNNTGHVIVNGGTFNYDVNHQYWAFEVHVDNTSALQNNGNGTWTVVPAVAYVAEQNNGYTRETGYATLEEAVASKYGNVVTLLTDVTLTDALVVEDGMDVTVKGEGKTITGCDGKDVFYVKGGKLTLTEGLNVHATTDCAIYLRGGDVFTAANLTKSGDKYSVIQGNGNYAGNVTITGGMVEASDKTAAIYWPQNGKLTITGGEITGHSAVYIASGSLEITGGTLHGVGANGEYSGVTGGSTDSPAEALTIENVGGDSGYELISSVVITDGTFISDNAKAVGSYANTTLNPDAEPVAGFISGGTFSSALEASYCAENYGPYAFEDGTFGVEYLTVDAITIEDGAEEEFVNQNTKTVGTLTYTRTLEKEKVWLALYVPFEIPVATLTGMGYEVAYFNDFRETFDSNGQIIEGKSVIEMVKITSGTLKANYPYAIKANNSDALDMEIVLNNVTLYSTVGEREYVECSSATKRFTFYGTYKKGTKKDLTGSDDILVYALNYKTEKMAQMSATASLGAFRIYMTATKKDGEPFYGSDVQPARSISLHVIGEQNENGETIIYDVVGSEQKSEAIFDLQGRRVLSPVKGNLYIINGKKVVY